MQTEVARKFNMSEQLTNCLQRNRSLNWRDLNAKNLTDGLTLTF